MTLGLAIVAGALPGITMLNAIVLVLPFTYFNTFIVVFCFLGAYALRNDLADVWLTMLFGILGFFMRRYDLPVPPLVMGVILGPLAVLPDQHGRPRQRRERVRPAPGERRDPAPVCGDGALAGPEDPARVAGPRRRG